MIKGFVQGQTLKLSQTKIVADSIDYLIAKFTFKGEEWKKLDKWMHLQKGESVYAVRLQNDKTKKEDHLNLDDGEWSIWLHGNAQEDGVVTERITTNVCTFYVEKSGALSGDVFPELPVGVSEQIMVRMDALGAQMDKVAAIPDAGELEDGRVLTVMDGKWQAADAPKGGSEMPTFNLVEMGLPTVDINGIQEVEADTTAIMTALDKGPVQFTFGVNIGVTVQASIVVNSLHAAGTYVCTSTPLVNDLYHLTFIVESGLIQVIFASLGDKQLPNLSESDEGKLLQVVGGAWKGVSVADSSIKTYIDDYINEALGGDY